MVATGSGYACGEDFPCFQYETFEDFKILIIHEFDFIFAENAILSPGEVEFLLVFRCTGA
jgi:hypothetical protein